MHTPTLALFLLLVSCACRSTAAPQTAHGKGLLSSDAAAPSGVETFDCPTWKTGDRYVFQKGGKFRMGFTAKVDEQGRRELVEDETGTALLLDAKLGELGQRSAAGSELDVTIDPVDVRFAWPLWVGKRWSCQFVQRSKKSEALPLFAHYRADAIESVTVPAGEFRCLRIWRTAQVAAQGSFADHVAVFWYSPDAGCVVKRLDEGLVTELAEYHRQ
jgi:hypothetical protein